MSDRIVDKWVVNEPAGASAELKSFARDLNRVLSRQSAELPVRRIDEADLSTAATTPYRLAIVPDSDDGITLAFFDTENGVWVPLQKQDAQLIALGGLSSVDNLVGLAGLTSAANKIPYFTGAGGASAIADFNPTRVSFTPTYLGTTTAGVTTYTTQTGNYMRIGGAVIFDLHMVWTATTGTGSARIGNLPITGGVNLPVLVYYNNFAHTAGRQLVGQIQNSTQIALFSCDPSGGGATQPAIDTAGEIKASGVYFI